jgi:hypothetical protein
MQVDASIGCIHKVQTQFLRNLARANGQPLIEGAKEFAPSRVCEALILLLACESLMTIST